MSVGGGERGRKEGGRMEIMSLTKCGMKGRIGMVLLNLSLALSQQYLLH